MSDGIEFRVIRTTVELESFRDEWNGLWWKDLHSTPFQRPEWIIPWWRQFGTPDLRAVTICDGGEAIGFLPLYVYREPLTGERKLMLLGVGTTDYLGGVFSPACTQQHLRAAFDLISTEGGWDSFYASQLRPGSLLFELLQQPENSAIEPFESASCSQMPAASMSELPVKIRRNAMYYRNRAARLGKLEFDIAENSNWEEAFDALRSLHMARWQNRGETGAFADERVVAWHLESIPQLQEAGILRLYMLRLDGHTIAAIYALVDPPGRPGRTQYVYVTAYSVEHAELRPGTVLFALATERAKQEGIETIDMLRGDEAYKKMWHLVPTPTYGFRMHSRAILSLSGYSAAFA